jgi:hypothetical protein
MPASDFAPSLRLPRRRAAFHSAIWQEFALGLLVGAGAGFALVRARPLAFALALLPVVVWLLLRPTVTAVLVGAALPALPSIAGTSLGSSNVALSDVMLVLAFAGILLSAAVGTSVPTIRSLRPVAVPLLQYGVFVLLLLPVHLARVEFLKTAQRFELFLIPVAVGAFVALRGRHVRVLQAYVLATTALAVIWPIHTFGMQKNPVGQMIANAIIVLVGVRALRGLLLCLPPLVLGLFLTQSRGALIAALIGFVVLSIASGARPGGFLARRGLALVVLALVAFAFMPASVKDRVTSLSASPNAPGAYAVQIRQRYAHDAGRIIAAHPWSGIGVGDYLAGDPAHATQTSDPHDVVLLEAAEGGYAFAVSFVVLILGSVFALSRLSRAVAVAPAAIAVLLATVAHGLGDIYWVRGTPVLGWLLVGMACGCALLNKRPEAPS